MPKQRKSMTLQFLKELQNETILQNNVTRLPWLSGAFDYRKEINLEQNWPLWQWE